MNKKNCIWTTPEPEKVLLVIFFRFFPQNLDQIQSSNLFKYVFLRCFCRYQVGEKLILGTKKGSSGKLLTNLLFLAINLILLSTFQYYPILKRLLFV